MSSITSESQKRVSDFINSVKNVLPAADKVTVYGIANGRTEDKLYLDSSLMKLEIPINEIEDIQPVTDSTDNTVAVTVKNAAAIRYINNQALSTPTPGNIEPAMNTNRLAAQPALPFRRRPTFGSCTSTTLYNIATITAGVLDASDDDFITVCDDELV